jgi:hypothetical protein
VELRYHNISLRCRMLYVSIPLTLTGPIFFIISIYLACEAISTAATPGLLWRWRWLWRSRWNVDWQGKRKFSEKTCPSATFVHHKIPHDQTRATVVGSRWLTAWTMARPTRPVQQPLQKIKEWKSPSLQIPCVCMSTEIGVSSYNSLQFITL